MRIIATFFAFFLLSGTLVAQTENYWTKKSDFTGLKRERAVAFTVGDKGYVGTGVDTAEMVLNDFWEYEPLTDTWSQVADFPGVPRRNATAFSIGDKGYVGTGMSDADANLGVTLSDFWEYDPATNSWTQKANYPSLAMYFGTGFAVGSRGYICCGKRGPNWYTTELWEYNPQTDAWSSKAPFPGGVRYQLTSFVVNSSAYVGLGTDQDMYRNDIWEYKPAQDLWTQKADLPGSERSASHGFGIGNYGFICMGANGGILDDLWEYNPLNNTWASKAPYGGSSRKNGIAFTLYGKAYVGLGKGVSGKKMSMHEYSPGGYVNLDEVASADIKVFPNPASDNISIQVSSTEIEQFEIYTLQGTKMLETSFASSITVDQLSSGVYLLVGKDNSGQIIGKEKLVIR